MNILKFFILVFLYNSSSFGSDADSLFSNFESKLYSINSRGIKDLMVEVESDKLTKQVSEYKALGKIEKLFFRLYWTSAPERFAVEVVGLPEGFREIKENLKSAVTPLFDYLNPPSIKQKFAGYEFSTSSQSSEIIGKDKSGILPIPSFNFRFDKEGKLTEVVGNRPVGTLMIRPSYETKPFSGGRLVLKEETTTSTENGQSLIQLKNFEYQTFDGVGLIDKIDVSIDQKISSEKKSSLKIKELIRFSNYKINEGVALKYFLGEIKN